MRPRYTRFRIEDRTRLSPAGVADVSVDEVMAVVEAVDGSGSDRILAVAADAVRRSELVAHLVTSAQDCFSASSSFRERISGPDGHDQLHSFMRHQVSAYLVREFGRDALAVLPETFDLGVSAAPAPHLAI